MARLGRGQPARPIVRRAPAPTGGTGSIHVAFTATGTGAKHASGTGTINIAFTLSGTGTKATAGTGEVDVAFTVTGSGTASTGIGTPPRPRVRWQLVLGPAAGGHELALTEASARKYVARLVEPSELTFSIDGRHPQALAIESLLTDVHLLWTGSDGQTRILDRCRVGAPQDAVTDKAHTTAVTCLDYKSVLNRRRLYAANQLVWAATDQGEIAWGLVTETQNNVGGALGISKGWVGTAPTGVIRDRTYAAGDSVGERITELSQVIDGFDWDIFPTSASGMELQVWHPERGVDRGVVLIYGGLIVSANRTEDTTGYANAIRYTGGGDPAPTPVELPDPLLAELEQGRWDAVFGDDGLTTQAALDDRAAWQLSQAQVVTPVWTVTMRDGAWDGPDHIWLGDPVRLVVQSGRLDVDTVLRVFEVDISLDGSGSETVALTLGGPRPDFRRRATATEKRLRDLERR